jgi:LmbE family N-acetylglucosaminyl deacetylase
MVLIMNPKARLVFPSGKEEKIREMCIVAHQDDIEFMTFSAILNCYNKNEKFGACVVTDGRGSPRTGEFASCTDDDMVEIRNKEQIKAGEIGRYGFVSLLMYPKPEVIKPENVNVTNDIQYLLERFRPEVVYTHNLADKHDTHVAVATKVIKSIKRMDRSHRPKALLGGEAWRSLDWLLDEEKVVRDVSDKPELSMNLLKVFESQIAGGKMYDVAVNGRRCANATFHESHNVDEMKKAEYFLDMTPLVENDTLSPSDFMTEVIDRMKNDVTNRLKKYD